MATEVDLYIMLSGNREGLANIEGLLREILPSIEASLSVNIMSIAHFTDEGFVAASHGLVDIACESQRVKTLRCRSWSGATEESGLLLLPMYKETLNASQSTWTLAIDEDFARGATVISDLLRREEGPLGVRGVINVLGREYPKWDAIYCRTTQLLPLLPLNPNVIPNPLCGGVSVFTSALENASVKIEEVA